MDKFKSLNDLIEDNMSQNSAIEKFENYVKNLHEIEYGDFKRKLSLYILRLEQGYGKKDARSQKIFHQMRDKTIYNADGNIDNSRAIVLDLAKSLKH